MNELQWVADMCARHQAAHALARACAIAVVPALFIAAWLRRRAALKAARLVRERGVCAADAIKSVARIRTLALAVAVIPPAVYALTSWLLDAALVWDCTLRPEVDFVGERIVVVLGFVTLALAGHIAYGYWRRRSA